MRALCDGQVGAVFSIEASRLARNGRDWHTLLEFCSIAGALLIDAEAVYDPRLTNDRLLLGMKGTISEMVVASFRERAHAAILQKAQRGALVRRVPIGYVKGSDDRIEKDPDARVASTIDLIFRKFAEWAAYDRFISAGISNEFSYQSCAGQMTYERSSGGPLDITRCSAC